MKNNLVKITLAVLLSICLFKMPYGYYQFVRVASVIGFIYLAVESKWIIEKIICVLLAVLFQPFYKFVIHKNQWDKIDIAVACLLVISIVVDLLFMKKK